MMTDEGTSGGMRGPSGGVPLRRLLILIVPVGVIVQVSINAMSRISDSAALGHPVSARTAWATELSSGAAILLLLPAIWVVLGVLMPARVGWPRAMVGHLVASLGFSLFHVALMTLFHLALLGSSQALVPPLSILLYEYRKDAWSYVLIACVLACARWMSAPRSSASPPDRGAAKFIVIQDGARRYRLPISEIEYVEAAGNYVQIATSGRQILQRSSLSELATELGEGFARIHRSRLVNREVIRSIEINQSGDFDIETVSGAWLKGSRRYRNEVQSCLGSSSNHTKLLDADSP